MDSKLIENQFLLKVLNLSTLLFFIFPLLGALVPWLIWKSKKEEIRYLDQIGKAVINFEITWCIMLLIGFVLNTIVQGVSGELNIITILFVNATFFVFMYLMHFIAVMVNIFIIHFKNKVKYYPKISFLRN